MACRDDSDDSVLTLRLHSLRGCDLPASLARDNVELLALGDFEATNRSAEVLALSSGGTPLPFPPATRAVFARLLGAGSTFSGYGERRDSALDLVLWPERAACAIFPVGRAAAYPGPSAGQAVAYSERSRLVFAAGGNDPRSTDALVGALTFDVDTGRVQTLGSGSGMHEPRAFASATPFGEGFLVAGGEHPVAGVNEVDLTLSESAEVFDVASGRFDSERITLLSSRTHHAALALDDGRTLLIGGRSKIGGASIAQYQLEMVDPVTRQTALGDAITARVDPRVVRLSDGRIFVAGGTGGDGAPAEPVAEWLSAGARLEPQKLSRDVAPRFERAFVALSGGGVLAVGGCEDRPATSDADRSACSTLCARGCPPLDGYDAWWIDARGEATRVDLDGIAAPRPLLLPGRDGRPWLIAAATEAPEIAELYRFDPWARRFDAISAAETQRLPRAGRAAPVTFDHDAFVWLDEGVERGALFGMRLGSRSRFAQDVALVLSRDAEDSSRPAHLVPSAPTGSSVGYDGALTLRRPDVSVAVADTDYADVTIELTLTSARLPEVVLGTTALGGPDCPWPDGPKRGGEFDLARVVRRGTRAELRFHGGLSSCPVPEGRLSLALRAGPGGAVISRLDVIRGRPD